MLNVMHFVVCVLSLWYLEPQNDTLTIPVYSLFFDIGTALYKYVKRKENYLKFLWCQAQKSLWSLFDRNPQSVSPQNFGNFVKIIGT